ncbi:hypothetical protein NECAME_10491 [Necator americanus]|uniref:Uncharacterized protein n=1 Tax=Necator americanus TaxID=51031 RepID=W2T8K4_NECAM|nr:hypothetical protein NECAME_10491 [Necator americanus]ETN78208.1 hypothetical protein NECAME_10491 [Necator americanus]
MACKGVAECGLSDPAGEEVSPKALSRAKRQCCYQMQTSCCPQQQQPQCNCVALQIKPQTFITK